MTEIERDRARSEGFNLAVRAFQRAHGIEIPGTEAEKLWDLLAEIAAGRETIVRSPGEWIRQFPNAPERTHQEFAHLANQLVLRDREVARSVLDALARLTQDR